MNGSRWHFPESVVVDAVAWNRADSVVVIDAVVWEGRNNCVGLDVEDVILGHRQLVVKPEAVHKSLRATRDAILEEIHALEIPESAQRAVEGIINKHFET
jgi:hypothetical protein